MKTTEITAETSKAIQKYLDLNKKFKGAYFWRPPSSADARRRYEKSNSFSYEGDGITLIFDVSCSCKNIYVTKFVKIDGVQRTAAALKKYIS